MRALVVEDDFDLSRSIQQAMVQAGFAVDVAHDGEDGAFLGETEPYDVIVLDLGLPILDGVAVLKRWRAGGITTPVLILTARDGWSEKVKGFDAGADDYLTKPFHIEELLARLRALIRRAAGKTQAVMSMAGLSLDPSSKRVELNGTLLTLTAHEYKILHYMMLHAGEVISRTVLTEHIYDQDFDRDSNTIEVFVGRLRKKIGAERIETLRGLGYRLREPVA